MGFMRSTHYTRCCPYSSVYGQGTTAIVVLVCNYKLVLGRMDRWDGEKQQQEPQKHQKMKRNG